MKSAAILALAMASADAFVPSTSLAGVKTATRGSSLQMASKAPVPTKAPYAWEDLVGADIETGGPFDPLGFGRNCPPEQMKWYRAAELKHGRVCMLATFGQIFQSFVHWNDPSGVFDQTDKPWAAMQQEPVGWESRCFVGHELSAEGQQIVDARSPNVENGANITGFQITAGAERRKSFAVMTTVVTYIPSFFTSQTIELLLKSFGLQIKSKASEVISLADVYEQRPLAFVQIILAIFAVEVWGNTQQQKSDMGGDFGWDPLGLRPSNPEAWEKTQLRELKNGRLAMIAIAGMITQEHISGLGVLERADPYAGLA